MTQYPIHINLQGRCCVVVGAGKVAERKVKSLLTAGAKIRLVSPKATAALKAWAEQGQIEWLPELYEAKHLDGAVLVMACTDNHAVNAAVTRDAGERNLLVLCADDPESGSFVSPTTITRGDLIITVSTGGKSPTLAAVLREHLEAEFGPEWEPLVEIIGTMREIVKTNTDEGKRKAAIRRVIEDSSVRALLAAGQQKEAETRIRECLSSSSE